jgi:predicted GNAT superfamily acetyltransferase
MIQAIEHAGNTVLVAVDQPLRVEDAAQQPSRNPEPPVGATLGFLGWAGGLHLHSHMNAVDPAARGRGIGVALKLRQRAVCLAHGVTEVWWTYDPLIRRNAHVNLVRLGAEFVAFLPDFYGELGDAITGADRSDRFEVRWRLDAPRTVRALARGPVPEWHADGGLALVADYEQVRADAPEVAARLRAASRDAFAALADGSGLRVELDANGDYVFTRDDPDRAP